MYENVTFPDWFLFKKEKERKEHERGREGEKGCELLLAFQKGDYVLGRRRLNINHR
jgi:hypothetical protein